MTKLAVLLCALLFASAANAGYWSDAVESVQQKVGEVIDASIGKVKEIYESVQKKANETSEKLLEEASKIGAKIQEEINKILQKTQDEIDKLTGKADGVDVTECNELAAHLEYTALAVLSNMSVCITDKLETGSGYIESIVSISENVLENLTRIREEAYHCAANVEDATSAAKAIVCVNVAAAKAGWYSTKVIPEMTIKIGKLSFLLGTLQPSLTYCTSRNGLYTLYKESATIIKRTKKCVQQKIDEAQATTPEIDYTTEKITHKPTTQEATTENHQTTKEYTHEPTTQEPTTEIHQTTKEYTHEPTTQEPTTEIHQTTKEYTHEPTTQKATTEIHQTTKEYTHEPTTQKATTEVHQTTKEYTHEPKTEETTPEIHYTTKEYTHEP